jgi:hypothetical protein
MQPLKDGKRKNQDSYSFQTGCYAEFDQETLSEYRRLSQLRPTTHSICLPVLQAFSARALYSLQDIKIARPAQTFLQDFQRGHLSSNESLLMDGTESDLSDEPQEDKVERIRPLGSTYLLSSAAIR